jgi:PTS system galactitol-specific IIA component
MNFEEILKEDLIFVRKHFESKEEVIRFLAGQLRQKGYVYETFADAVVEREEKYPTGLYLGKINVAIPHTDPKHVKQTGVTVLTLDKPVFFNRMDEPSKSIPVHIVFLLAVSEGKEYVQFLSEIVNLFDEKILERMYKETTNMKIIKLLKMCMKSKLYIEQEGGGVFR